jgi:hypothetical protein
MRPAMYGFGIAGVIAFNSPFAFERARTRPKSHRSLDRHRRLGCTVLAQMMVLVSEVLQTPPENQSIGETYVFNSPRFASR